MASSLLPALLLAATASAQVTTTFVGALHPLDTDKIGYVGSVVAVNNSQTIVVLGYDDGTDTSALSIAGSNPQTMTIGPNLWGQQDDLNLPVPGDQSGTASNNHIYNVYCEGWDNTAANWTCTSSYGASIAAIIQCNTGTGNSEASTETFYNTHSYPARLNYSAGTETVTHSFVFAPDTTSIPSWCSDDPMNLPDEGSSEAYESAATRFATYQVVLTAGLEKLGATQAATPTIGSAVPTGSVNSTASGALPEFTAGAAKVVGGKTLIAGMGVAVAAYFL
jgi:hypothetical protein